MEFMYVAEFAGVSITENEVQYYIFTWLCRRNYKVKNLITKFILCDWNTRKYRNTGARRVSVFSIAVLCVPLDQLSWGVIFIFTRTLLIFLSTSAERMNPRRFPVLRKIFCMVPLYEKMVCIFQKWLGWNRGSIFASFMVKYD